jgi:ribosomal protein S18 acetylase RimI-like enzyme
MQPMTVPIFEHIVLSKPYFDRQGLIVAVLDGQPVGFVHASLGPNSQKSDIGSELGVICLLQVLPQFSTREIRDGLLARAESYLIDRGVRVIRGGGFPAVSPYYLGLYGGSELPGVIDSDRTLRESLRNAGYQEKAKFHTMHRRLSQFRPPMDRSQHLLSRQFRVDVELDHQFDNWWDSCTLGMTQHGCFHLASSLNGDRVGSLIFWDLEPLASSWGIPSVGLSRLWIADDQQDKGLATFLLAQALRHFVGMSTALAEVQVPWESQTALGLFRKLGFEIVDGGVAFEKRIS